MKSDFFWSEIGSRFVEQGGTPPPTIPGSTPTAVHLPLVAIGEAAKDFCKRQSCNRLSPDVGFWMRPRFSPLEVGRMAGRAVGRSCEGKSQFNSSPYLSRLNSLNYNHWLQKDPLDETFKPDKVPRRLGILRRIIHAPSKWSNIIPLALTTFTFLLDWNNCFLIPSSCL